jgi:N-acetylmuramoyl-L-alanine amidase
MPTPHTLKPGECLQSLAQAYGFKEGKQIYDAAENAELRQKRPAPADVAPGDAVVIPDRTRRPLALETGKVHRFVVTLPAAMLRLEVRDEAGEPLAGKPYELHVGDAKLAGTTTGDGVVEQPVPLEVDVATLVVHESAAKDEGRWSWRLRLASLEAPETLRGAWQRLTNLGYWSGDEAPEEAAEDENAPEPTMRDPLVFAIRAFQHDEQIEETGRLDAAMKSRLKERHGI